jgi:hypothetical protein
MQRQEKIDRLKEYIRSNFIVYNLIDTTEYNQISINSIIIDIENNKLKFIYQDGSIKYEDELTDEEIVIM